MGRNTGTSTKRSSASLPGLSADLYNLLNFPFLNPAVCSFRGRDLNQLLLNYYKIVNRFIHGKSGVFNMLG